MTSIAYAFLIAACGVLLLRIVLSFRSLLFLLGRCWRLLDDRAQSYQIYVVPSRDASGQPNPLYRKALAYVASLPSLEGSNRAHILSTGKKPNDFYVQPDLGQPVADSFLGARVRWVHQEGFLLRLRRQDRHRVLRPYLQHVEAVADEIEARKKETRLFTNSSENENSWCSIPFSHPATLDTVAMDTELKNRIRLDLESFLKGKGYYARLGRVWKRSYLLYGRPGTGKSTFVAAMAKFLSYDVYDLDLSKTKSADLKPLLQQTTPKSVILIEDLDRYLKEKELTSAMLNFMDGVFSCCGDERVVVFTMCREDKEGMDPALLRPGRLDVQIHFPLCDFTAFKTLASSYLGLKDHKLYPQVEEGFERGARLSPAEVGEIMIANRGSPSRALKNVISALHQSRMVVIAAAAAAAAEGRSAVGHRVVEEIEGCGVGGGMGFGKDATLREIKKLYGMMIRRSGSKREGTMSVEMAAAAAAAAMAGDNGSKDNGSSEGL